MPKLVVHGAKLQCSMGSSPGSFSAGTPRNVDGGRMPAGTVNDTLANTNIGPFGLCQSPSNPQVAAATAAANGALTPQPCEPLVTAPWTPGAKAARAGGAAVLTDNCQCACQWAGSITVTDAGQGGVTTK